MPDTRPCSYRYSILSRDTVFQKGHHNSANHPDSSKVKPNFFNISPPTVTTFLELIMNLDARHTSSSESFIPKQRRACMNSPTNSISSASITTGKKYFRNWRSCFHFSERRANRHHELRVKTR